MEGRGKNTEEKKERRKDKKKKEKVVGLKEKSPFVRLTDLRVGGFNVILELS